MDGETNRSSRKALATAAPANAETANQDESRQEERVVGSLATTQTKVKLDKMMHSFESFDDNMRIGTRVRRTI